MAPLLQLYGGIRDQPRRSEDLAGWWDDLCEIVRRFRTFRTYTVASSQPSLRDPDPEYIRGPLWTTTAARVLCADWYLQEDPAGFEISGVTGNISSKCAACRESVKNRYAIIKSAVEVRRFKLWSARATLLNPARSISRRATLKTFLSRERNMYVINGERAF